MYYLNRSEQVVLLTGWTNTQDPLEHLAERSKLKNVTSENVLHRNVIFLLDEAQSSYEDFEFWLVVIKGQSNRRSGARLCLFSSYGSPATGSTVHSVFRSTPVHLGPAQRVSLTVSQVKNSPDFSLFYNEEEYYDVIQRLCSRPPTTCKFSREAQDYLFSITNGHAGATTSMMTYIYDVCNHALFAIHSIAFQKLIPLFLLLPFPVLPSPSKEGGKQTNH